MSEEWGPTDKASPAFGSQPAYLFQVDRLACCGCVVHSGAETSDCDCRCHWAARLAAKPQFANVGRK